MRIRNNARMLGRRLAVVLAALAVGATTSVLAPARPAAAAAALVGTFQLTAGSCAGGVSGSYIRMILPSGGPTGPFMSNSDSTCHDQSYTLLRPGSDGGLSTASYQPPPSPAFDSTGNALAHRVTAPANFYGTSFATGTSARDPQTGAAVPAPRVTVSSGRLSADLRAFAVTWNNQNFNQGAPKPDGGRPGNTRTATGTYNATTGAFTLQWTSQVVGGPFDKFTGLWHLTGRFVPAAANRAGANGSAGGNASSGRSADRPVGSSSTGRTVAAPGAGSVGAGPTGSGQAAVGPSADRAAASAPAGGGAAAPVAATTTISRDHWQVSWWLVAVVIVLAGLGLVALGAINRALRKGLPS